MTTKLKKIPQYHSFAKTNYSLPQAIARYCSLYGLQPWMVIEGQHTSSHFFLGHYVEVRN